MSGVRVQRDGESATCVASLVGDVDLTLVPEVLEVLGPAIDSGCAHVVVDLTEVTYADSTALWLLAWLNKKLEPLDGRVVLCGVNPDVTRILELSGLVAVAPTISTHPSLAEGLASLEAGAPTQSPLWEETIDSGADLSQLAATRSRVSQLVERLDIDESTVFDIRVAVGEALANAIRHGSPRGAGDKIVVRVSAYPDKVAVDVGDSGCGFDGSHQATDDVFAEGGRGVMFMRALMDRVAFSRCPGGGTMVTLVKSIRCAS